MRGKDIVLPVQVPREEEMMQVIWQVLDLVFKPIDLKLLGLHRSVDTVRDRLTADLQGGSLDASALQFH